MKYRIQTSCFGRIKALPDNVIPVSIARWSPRWYRGRREIRLAPSVTSLKSESHSDTERAQMFFDQLYELDAEEIVDSLLSQVPKDGGIAMLCYESPGDPCHRRLVAEWIEVHCGIVVPEVGFKRSETETYYDWK